MLIKRPGSAQPQSVNMEGAVGVKMAVLIGPQENAPTCVMRRFTIEPGGHTPKHQHPFEHEVLITRGQGVVFSEATGEKPVLTGDAVYVAPNEMHQFRNTSPLPMEFICIIPADCQCMRK